MRHRLLVVLVGMLSSVNAVAQDLIVDGTSVTLGGIKTYGKVEVKNGGKILVPVFNGTDKVNTGNLQIHANTILVDATSAILADGKGYQPKMCDHGPGATATAGGRGGCAVLDSGGGGAHFGRGGRGTKDCNCVSPTATCQFPVEFEEDCGTLAANGTSCSFAAGTPGGVCPAAGVCYNYDGLPSVAGQSYWHSIYQPEFGAAGGDKGCRDGFDTCSVAGAGGGRIVLAAVNAGKTGVLTIQGQVSASGHRGCGSGNDSGGGGAGGSLLLVGDTVNIVSTAKISAAGGLGGDTNAKQPGSTCPTCAQAPGGTCDDCGGGGGGGIISVLAGKPASIASLAVFNVAGAKGGTCTICKGEAGGGAGELQLSGAYTGEFCDGYDNDFNGVVDDGLGNVSCGTGACQKTVPQCTAALPNDCAPLSTPSCQPPLTDTRSRFMVIVDTSGSMLTDLNGNYTFGDGSLGHEGLNTDSDGKTNDSRLYKAKAALTKVISAYPEIDFGLARFAQGVDLKVNCQLAHWFECAGLCCTYDNPTNNTGGTPPEGPCSIMVGTTNVTVQPTSPGDECINYAGWCGQPHRGADVLVGFEKPIGQKLMWLDHKESKFIKDITEGNHCSYATGGDCELRGTGPTPLAGALYAAKAYVVGQKASDPIGFCRKYATILLTDGAETCNGDPKTAAATLLTTGIETYVIGFSVLVSEKAQLDTIANAGSTSGTRPAFFVGDENQLAAALASIVADSVVFEKCNNKDDDCDLLVDEDFPLKGQPCNNGLMGICYKIGQYVCKADGSGVVCNAQAVSGLPEKCNGLDDDCNGAVDDVNQTCTTDANCQASVGNATCSSGKCICQVCAPQPEVCNGKDDDCDNVVDEDFTSQPCGKDLGECKPGNTKCLGGKIICDGGSAPTTELCNGLDDDCDGTRDWMSESCYSYPTGCTQDPTTKLWTCTGFCKAGIRTCTATQTAGTWSGVWSSCVGDLGPGKEECNGLDDNCDGQVDEMAECPAGSQCINGACTLPCGAGEFICPKGQICKDDWCIPDPCDADTCGALGWICKAGQCINPCLNVTCPGTFDKCVKGACVDTSCYNPKNACPQGQVCVQGECQADPCVGVSCGTDSFCSDGACVKLCDAVVCPSGEMCKVVSQSGSPVASCVKDACASQSCDAPYVCQDGTCVKDPCNTVSCPTGQICIAGACVADPCEKVTCPTGYSCSEGMCASSRTGTTRDMLATGAGGCSCSMERGASIGASPPLLALLLLGLVLRRRGRSGGDA